MSCLNLDPLSNSDGINKLKAEHVSIIPPGKIVSTGSGFASEASSHHTSTLSKISKIKIARFSASGPLKALNAIKTLASGISAVAGVAQTAAGIYFVVQAGKNLKNIAKGPYNPIQGAQVASAGGDSVIAGITSALALFVATLMAAPSGFDPNVAAQIYATNPVPMQVASILIPVGLLLGSTVIGTVELADTMSNVF